MTEEPATGTTRPRPRAAAFGFIFATALMNSISFGIMIPILPNLIKQMTGGDTAAASEWNVLFATTWGAMQFLFGPLLGMLSDRFGRRPVLLISIFGLFVDFLFMAFAPTLPLLFLGRIFNGMTASSFSTANAYVADVTPPEQRARNFGLMGSAFGFGFMIGPSLGGVIGEHGLRLPFIAAAAICLVNWLYGLFVLPESLPADRRPAQVRWARANPFGALAFLRDHGEVLGLAVINFLFQFAHNVLPTIFVLYTGYRYGWTPQILGFTFLATGALQTSVQILLVGRVVRAVGERGAVLIGTAAGATAFAVYAMADRWQIYVAAMPIFALTGLIQPGLMGLMSRRVEPQRQGQLQGASQSLQGVASILGPPVFGLTFALAVRHDASLHQPGLPIFIASVLLAVAFSLALRWAKPVPGPVPLAATA